MNTGASLELPPAEIPGYPGGPFSHQPELLNQPLFILGHLYGCVHSEEAEEALFGADYESSAEFHRALREAADWPTFALPLPGDHWLYIVYRTFEDDPGVDYLVYHQGWDSAETIASDEGHFRGPGLSWAELEAVALNGAPGGSTDDPHARLLLLLPALGDAQPADNAADTIALALSALTQLDDPNQAADHLLIGQCQAGPADWRMSEDGIWTCDGRYAYRTHGSLAHHRLARISTALNQPNVERSSHGAANL